MNGALSLTVYGRPLEWRTSSWAYGDRLIEGAGEVKLYDHVAVSSPDGTRLATYVVIEIIRPGPRFTGERLMDAIARTSVLEDGRTLADAIEDTLASPTTPAATEETPE